MIMRKLLFILFAPLIVTAQKDHAQLLQQYMTGQNKYFQFNGTILVAEKGKPFTSRHWDMQITIANEC
jgi:hypothetical protein